MGLQSFRSGAFASAPTSGPDFATPIPARLEACLGGALRSGVSCGGLIIRWPKWIAPVVQPGGNRCHDRGDLSRSRFP